MRCTEAGSLPRARASAAGRLRTAAAAPAAAWLLGLAGLIGPAAAPAPAAAQEVSELQERFLLPVPRTAAEDALRQRTWTVPGASIATPTAFGADLGVVWLGGSFQARARYSDGADAAAGAGFGLGDARHTVGLQVAVNSFTTFRNGFFTRAGVDLHLHRQLGGGLAAAVGWESAVSRGFQDGGESQYAVLSQWIDLGRADQPFSALMVSLGVGNGRFQSETDFAAGKNELNPFGSAALRVLPPVSVIADWTGQDLFLATSVAPFREVGLVGTVGVADLLGRAGDGARLVAGGSLSHDFLNSK